MDTDDSGGIAEGTKLVRVGTRFRKSQVKQAPGTRTLPRMPNSIIIWRRSGITLASQSPLRGILGSRGEARSCRSDYTTFEASPTAGRREATRRSIDEIRPVPKPVPGFVRGRRLGAS